MTLTSGIILGIIIGWLGEWIIDWLYWRGRRGSPAPKQVTRASAVTPVSQYSAELEAAYAENETLKNRLGRYATVGDDLIKENQELRGQLDKCKSLADRLTAENTRLKNLPGKYSSAPDDLKVIKGIGPEIERILHQAGILTFAQLAELTPAQLEGILGSMIKRLANEQDLLDQARELARMNK